MNSGKVRPVNQVTLAEMANRVTSAGKLQLTVATHGMGKHKAIVISGNFPPDVFIVSQIFVG